MDHAPGFLSLVNDAKMRIREVSVMEASSMISQRGARLIDVREDGEWQAGHAMGAMHIGRGVLERDIEGKIPNRDETLLCYCGGGFRSALAVDHLQKMGYRNALSVAGGYRAWMNAGLRTTTLPETLPRSPYEKLAGIVYLPRLADKKRLFPEGMPAQHEPLTSFLDQNLLDFLCIEAAVFTQLASRLSGDDMILAFLKQKLAEAWPSDHAVVAFNEKMSQKRPDTPEKQSAFDTARLRFPATKKKVETYFDLIDLEEGRVL